MKLTNLAMTLCAVLTAATASAQSLTVGGAVFEDPTNPLFSGVDGVEITVSGPAGTFTVTTSMLGGVWSGFWRIDDVPPGNYSVTPALDGFEFRRWLFGQVLQESSATIVVSAANRAEIGSVSFLVLPAGSGCDDGNPCTVGDVFQDDGGCRGVPTANGTACDDGNPCTSGDSCVVGACTGTPVVGCGGGGGGGSGGGTGGGTTPDADADGVPDSVDNCPNTPNGTTRGVCLEGTQDPCQSDADCAGTGSGRCSVAQADLDDDGRGDACDDDRDGDGTDNDDDGCPDDGDKVAPGTCGCGVIETPDCFDGCPDDPNKTAPGLCGCGASDADSDDDGTPDCLDGCPLDALKLDAGVCGCGTADGDRDGDGQADCRDGCPDDANKSSPGLCGCGAVDDDTDTDRDGLADCADPCPGDADNGCITGGGDPVNQPDVPTGADDGACGFGCGPAGAPPLAGILLFLLATRLRQPGVHRRRRSPRG